jgi:predicted Rossmann-fold nucleotide-binding protein
MAAAGRFHVFAGGYGTLDELLEVIAWAQLGIHSKPVSAVLVDTPVVRRGSEHAWSIARVGHAYYHP